MLEHLGEVEAGRAVMQSIHHVLSSPEPTLTPDLGGRATTRELGAAIVAALEAGESHLELG
jgi:tartrate dehydrogenase/decarboxylase/D-malate dehydrogenase